MTGSQALASLNLGIVLTNLQAGSFVEGRLVVKQHGNSQLGLGHTNVISLVDLVL